ncbi:adenylosuccinate lyase [Vulgatibacter incomptus]|uniref:Adenylosuccinate lyase n=1 Tax=Vulgatibacter incomptus TaxID=1391653 RepID=A0A0K1P954_9BACT|nr:adenylosuccinate lyase [Vulgatibacter incomptus]AKU90037.1 Adenylosuccinate lyase [Vulgatibacter incomptus]
MIARYARPEMTALWTSEARYERWLAVELAAAEAMAKRGEVPQADYDALVAKAPKQITAEDAERIEEIEKTVKHDVIAFLTFVEEKVGPEARWLHLGLTSSDVLDTTLALQLKEAGEKILAGVDRALEAIEKRAFEHKDTPMIGRSHGIHAEPITFGLKMASWYAELSRDRARLAEAVHGVAHGMISGAVGTFANVDPEVEAHVCRKLGLEPDPVTTQVISRDRHADFFHALALMGASLERFSVEVRHLQRTEVREAEEPFTPGQKGSSAMPHKRNPILTENMTGLARLLRGYASTAMENVALWHERDISHSSVERVIGPDATVLADFMLHRFTRLVAEMRVYPERMRENLEITGGLIYSQRLLLELARRGVARQTAYVFVQRNAMKFYEEGTDFLEALLADEDLRKHLSEDEIRGVFELGYHTKHVDEIFRRVFGKA